MAPLCGDMHRGVRLVALHVREQLPGRQGLLQLSGLLECLQASDKRREQCRKGRSLRANRNAVLSARHEQLTATAFHQSGSRSGRATGTSAGVVAGLVPVTPTIFAPRCRAHCRYGRFTPASGPLAACQRGGLGLGADIESRSSHISVQTSRPCRDRSCSCVLKAAAPVAHSDGVHVRADQLQ